MDYDYGQEQAQFQENSVAYNGGVEEEDDYYDETQEQQQRIEVGGNGRNQFSNRDSSLSNSSSSQGKLFVGGVAWETTSDTFTHYFGKYGEITDAIIMTDRNSGRPRGFGFVTFADPAVADRVLEEEHIIDGRTVEVKRTVPREEMDTRGIVRVKKIFVGGIPPSLESDELKEYFSNYGNVVDCQIMIDHKTGRPRGFGFVTFDSEDSVQEIFSEGKTHELGGKQVEIKTAVPKRNGDASFSNRSSSYDASNTLEGMYPGKMGRGYGGYSGFGGYNNGYGGYAGGYGAVTGFYGGYCFGYGYGGPMLYGGGGYGNTGYGSSSGYGSIGGYGYGRSNGSNRGNSGGENGGASATSRYHPYQK